MKLLRPRPSRRALTILFAALMVGVLAPSARAQLRGLTPQIIESPTPSDADREQIGRYVDSHKGDLSSGEKDRVRRARNALAEPLESGRASIAFRVEYTRLLVADLQRLASNERDFVAANAMHLAGELATPSAAESVLIPGLRDRRPPVRHAAAFGFKRTFEHMQRSSSVFRPENAESVLRELSAAIGREADPHALEGLTRAFEAAAMVPDERLRGLRHNATATLARAMGERARKAQAQLEIAPALIRAGQVIRNATVNEGMAAQEPQLPQAVLRDAGGYGGDLMALVKCVLADEQKPTNLDRGQLAALAASGEAICFFANTALGGRGQVTETDLSAFVRDQRDADYIRAVEQYIGRAGLLAGQPFGLQADRFACQPRAAGPR